VTFWSGLGEARLKFLHAYSLGEDGICPLSGYPLHQTHPEIVKRLRRAEGHLRSIIEMIETRRPCLDVAQQLYAVKKAIAQAKKTPIHDHIENCLEQEVGPLARAQRSPIDEFKVITKHLNVADHGRAD